MRVDSFLPLGSGPPNRVGCLVLFGFFSLLTSRNVSVPFEVGKRNSERFGGATAIEAYRIAFSRLVGANGAIYVMNADGSNVRRLTRGKGDESPSWSPDGKWIAFDSREAGSWDIYLISPEGSNLRRLVHLDGPAWGPAWSPDGQRIAFEKGIPGTHRVEIFVMQADGSEIRTLTRQGGFFTYSQQPTWSPDGKKIAFVSNRNLDIRWKTELYMMNADGSGVRRLTYDRAKAASPAWSPDGKHILFVSDRESKYAIYAVGPDGTGLAKVSDVGGCCPAWSADGKYIAFSALAGRHPKARLEIYIMNADGSNPRPLTEGFHPSFGPVAPAVKTREE